MSYPHLQIPHPWAWWGDDLAYLLQTVSPAAVAAVRVYAATDTGYATPLWTGAGTTDASGDLLGAVPVVESALPAGYYLLRVSGAFGDYAAEFAVSKVANLLALLDGALGAYRAVPRHNEPAQLAMDRYSARWGYGHWQLAPEPVITQNDEQQVGRGDLKLDYATGVATLLDAADAGVELLAGYRFAYLDDATLYTFLRRALHMLNTRPPFTSFNFQTMPTQWEAAITTAAHGMALQKLVMDLHTFQWRRVFENPDGMAQAASALLAGVTAELKDLLATAKRRGQLPIGVIRGHDVGRVPALVEGHNFRQYTILG